MSVEIALTRIASANPQLVLFSGSQESVFGGASLPIPSMGDRFAVAYTSTRLRPEIDTRALIASLVEATALDGRMPFPQPGLRQSVSPGAAVVDGAGQAGTAIALRSVTPRYTIRRGQYFNVVHRGVHILLMATREVTVGGDGKAVVPIWPMLRFLTVDGSPCRFDPVIEGKVTGFDKGWTHVRARTEAISFTITERR